MKNEIKFVDLFAGLGGFRKALEDVSQNKSFNTKCVFVSEINENVIETYIKNFGEDRKSIINIRDIDEKCDLVPDHDFLFAGFPCQTFSNAGHKKGFLDEIRGTLFFEIAKILNAKKPKYAILENVKHIVNHDNGKTWKIIIETLKNIGYIIPNKALILNPLNFGIPQDRQRVFIPMILKEKINTKNIDYIDFDFSKYFNDQFTRKNDWKITKKIIYNEYLDKKYDKKYLLKSTEYGKYLIKVFDAWNDFLKNVNSDQKTLPVIWIDYLNDKRFSINDLPIWKQKYLMNIWKIYDVNRIFIEKWKLQWEVDMWKKRERKFEWQAGIDIKDITHSFIQLRQSGIRCRRPINFPTLVAMVQIPIIFHKNEWRYLTPRETAHLQSIPKNYKLYNEIKDNSNSDFLTYMQIGNSVNVKMVAMIQEKLLEIN